VKRLDREERDDEKEMRKPVVMTTEVLDAIDAARFRASCLSCLGDICVSMQWSVTPYLWRIARHIAGLLHHEHGISGSVEVRRAACHLALQLLPATQSTLSH
jgi:hypothetical protein